MSPPFTLQHVRDTDPIRIDLLEDILLLAAYWRPNSTHPPRKTALNRPDLRKLLEDWGRSGDTAVIAKKDDTVVGAAWFRYWTDENHSYGYLSPNIPELALGVQPNHRRQGIGRAILNALLGAAHKQGISKLSLSVEQDNPARILYESAGFRIHHQIGNALTLFAETAQKGEQEENDHESSTQRQRN